MDTRERLRQQRKLEWKTTTPTLAVGLIVGWSVGFIGRIGGGEGLTPHFAYTLIAFGLGAVVALLGQYFIRKQPQV